MHQGRYAAIWQAAAQRRLSVGRIGRGWLVLGMFVGAAALAAAPSGPAGASGGHPVVRADSVGTASGSARAPAPGTTPTATAPAGRTAVTTTTHPTSVSTSTTTVTTSIAGTTSTTTTTTTTTVVATTRPPTTGGSTQPGTGTVTTTTTTTVPVNVPATTGTPGTSPTTTPTTVPGPPNFDATCSSPATPGLQDYLDSLPAGSVFQSSANACYDVPSGIHLRQPITLVGGMFYDPSTAVPATSRNGLRPIIAVAETSHVVLVGLTVLGANVSGQFHARLVGEAGVKLLSATDVTITGVTAENTWGDGLELVAHTPIDPTPVTGLTVEGFTTINAGRQGVTLAEVSRSTLDDVHIVSPADAGFDFESDIARRGSDNVTISNCVDDTGFNMVEYLGGPITISNCTGFHHVALASQGSDAPVTFIGGAMKCRRSDPQPCISQIGGSLKFSGVFVGREKSSGSVGVPTWRVRDSGTLLFDNSSLVAPYGTVDSTSSVTIRQ